MRKQDEMLFSILVASSGLSIFPVLTSFNVFLQSEENFCQVAIREGFFNAVT